MYTTTADNSTSIAWNNGNATGYVDVSVPDWNTGEANTTTLAAADSDSGTGGTQPHLAAQLCDNLSANGHTDWYLPALNELGVLNTNKTAIGNFTTNSYWTSTRNNASNAWLYTFNIDIQFNTPKHTANYVRCVRK